MFRTMNQILATLMAIGIAGGFAGGHAFASAKPVALVCDGEYRVQAAGIEGSTETSFPGTMHVALVEQDGRFVEIRLQAYEGETRLPVQQFLLAPEPEMMVDADTAPKNHLMPKTALVTRADTPAIPAPASEIRIESSATEVMLHKTTETGPMMRARVDGRPLVPTRESIATIDMRLNRIDGGLRLVWSENRVRNHRLPGAIRSSKVRFLDEKTFDASCRPVRQRAF